MGVVVYLGPNRHVREMWLLFPGSPSRDLLQVRRQLEQTATWTTLTTFSNSSRLELTHTSSVFRNVRQCLGGRTTRINNHVSCLFACHDSSVECQYDGCIRKDGPSSHRCICRPRMHPLLTPATYVAVIINVNPHLMWLWIQVNLDITEPFNGLLSLFLSLLTEQLQTSHHTQRSDWFVCKLVWEFFRTMPYEYEYMTCNS